MDISVRFFQFLPTLYFLIKIPPRAVTERLLEYEYFSIADALANVSLIKRES